MTKTPSAETAQRQPQLLTIGDESWLFYMDFNSLCDVEGDVGLDMQEAAERMRRGSMTTLRAFMTHSLRSAKGERATPEQAAEVIVKLGVPRTIELIATDLGAIFSA